LLLTTVHKVPHRCATRAVVNEPITLLVTRSPEWLRSFRATHLSRESLFRLCKRNHRRGRPRLPYFSHLNVSLLRPFLLLSSPRSNGLTSVVDPFYSLVRSTTGFLIN